MSAEPPPAKRRKEDSEDGTKPAQDWTISRLKDFLRSRGALLKGNRAELHQRLLTVI